MGKPDPDYDVTEGESTLRGVVLPGALIVAGFSVRIVFALFMHASAGQSVGLVISQLIISLFIMLIGCFTASAMMSLNFGPVDRAAAPKLSEATKVDKPSGAIGTMIAAAGPVTNVGPNMGLVAWYVVVLCYLVFFAIFFSHSLGIQETFLTVCIIVLMARNWPFLEMLPSAALLGGIGHPLALFFTR